LKQKFNDRHIHLSDEEDGLMSGQRGGQEWVQEELSIIVEIFKDVLKEFPDAEMCYQDKRYKFHNGTIEESRLPNCRLEFLGILDGDIIKCVDGQSFEVKDNGIMVNGETMTLSAYIKSIKTREGNTNEFNGYMYFRYKGDKKTLYDMWQSLVKGRDL